MKAIDYLGLMRCWFFKDAPAQVIFFVTARCNMKCRMCFYWRNVNAAEGIKELTIDEIASISKNMKPFFWLMISGGEPFLRKELAEICEVFSKNNKVKNITIPTNGFEADTIIKTLEDTLNRIDNAYLNINFSLDGIGMEHDKIRGVPGAFERVIKSYKAVKRLKKIYPNLSVAVNIVYSPLNQGRILELSDYILANLRPDNLALAFVRGDTRDKLMVDNLPLEVYRQLLDKITLAVIKGELPFYGLPFKYFVYAKDVLMRKIIYRTRKTGHYQIPCYAGQLSIVISEKGEVFPCELRGRPLGNFRENDYDLNRILTKDKMAQLKKEIIKGRCFCTHECFYTMNILFNLRQYPALLREWAGLKLRKLYAAVK